MADNPFDQFDTPAQTQAPSAQATGNPFDQFDAAGARPAQPQEPGVRPAWSMKTGAGKYITQPLLQPVVETFQNLGHGESEAYHQQRQGWEQLKEGDVLSGLKNYGLGTLGEVTAPLDAIPKALTDQFVRRPLGTDEGWKRYVANTVQAVGDIFGPGVASKLIRGGADVVNGLLPQATQETARTLADFKAANVTPTMAPVTGNKSIGTVTKSLSEVPFVGESIVNSAKQNVSEAANEAGRIADTYGTAARPEEGGEALKEAYNQFKGDRTKPVSYETARSSNTRDIGFIPKSDALYNNIPIVDNQPAVLNSTTQRLDDLLEKYGSNPAFQQFMQNNDLAKLRDTIKGKPPTYGVDPNGLPFVTDPGVPGGLSWADLKDLRTDVGKWMRDPPGQLGVGRDDWRQLYGALSDDMKATAANTSPDALKAFNQANRYYKTGLARLNDTLDFINAADSPEIAYDKLTKMAAERGRAANISKLETTMKSLPDEFRDDVAATMINRMGLPRAHVAGAATDDFSLASWSTNYNNLSDRAKDAIFGQTGGARRDSLDTLARVVDKLQNVDRLANTSGTSRIGATKALLAGIVLSPTKTIPLVASGNIISRALVSPRLTNWLVNSSRARTLAAQQAQQQQLGTLAKRMPAAAALYGSLYDND